MKKVIAFDGSPRKRHTYRSAADFLHMLETRGDVETELVRLTDYRIGICKGCQCCFDRGEEFCPLKDDRDLLFAKITEADGVVLVTPNYSFQVSGTMKLFLDRFGFLFHRPRFHRKTFSSIVVQGIFGGEKIVKYLDFVGAGLGFDVVKGACLTTREPMTRKAEEKRIETLGKLAARFHEGLSRSPEHVPTLRELMVFRLSRNGIRQQLNEDYLDYRYYSEHGWFESGYYYPVKLGLAKKAAGRALDAVAARLYKPRSPNAER